MGRPLWCGGDTVVVQLGDVLDRGDCEIGTPFAIIWFSSPARNAIEEDCEGYIALSTSHVQA